MYSKLKWKYPNRSENFSLVGSIKMFNKRLADWLIGWLANRLINMNDWLTDQLTNQFTLSTQLTILNYPVTLSHRRSITVSLETCSLYLFDWLTDWLADQLTDWCTWVYLISFRILIKNYEVRMFSLCGVVWKRALDYVTLTKRRQKSSLLELEKFSSRNDGTDHLLTWTLKWSLLGTVTLNNWIF